jgi:hypothetical protein
MADITLRALKVLAEVDAVIAEDTRVTGRLLQHHGISRPLIPFHAHNEHRMVEQLVQRLRDGERFAMVSDAGTRASATPVSFWCVRLWPPGFWWNVCLGPRPLCPPWSEVAYHAIVSCSKGSCR